MPPGGFSAGHTPGTHLLLAVRLVWMPVGAREDGDSESPHELLNQHTGTLPRVAGMAKGQDFYLEGLSVPCSCPQQPGHRNWLSTSFLCLPWPGQWLPVLEARRVALLARPPVLLHAGPNACVPSVL